MFQLLTLLLSSLLVSMIFQQRLDNALIRPGRVDMRVALGFADETQIEKHFLNFYPEATLELAKKFAQAVGGSKLSMAHIQGHFLLNKNNPEAAIAGAAALRQQATTL